MWYVNVTEMQRTKALGLPFILTMWYVNYRSNNYFNSIYYIFYINYVICKFGAYINEGTVANDFYINYVICKYLVRIFLNHYDLQLLY